jgi:hypothetical protein
VGYAQLAEIRLRQGLIREAVALQQQAVAHAPQSAAFHDSLTAYQAMAGRPDVSEQPKEETEVVQASFRCPIEQLRRQEYPEMAASVDGLDWSLLENALTAQGCCPIPELLSAETCQRLRQMFHDDGLFDKTVVMNKDRFGEGTYRYFSAPIPNLVDAIRRIVYPHVARVANHWQRLLGEDEFFPTVWEGFRHRCTEFGQTTPTPLLLRYEAGGFNDLHRDIRGEVFFPIQMAIVLSAKVDSTIGNEDGFQGGDFLFCDDPVRKKSDRRAIPAGLGDVVLFCTRARLVPIAGVYGWQPVKHGVDRIEAGTRYVLGVPFHEYQ